MKSILCPEITSLEVNLRGDMPKNGGENFSGKYAGGRLEDIQPPLKMSPFFP
jgi:hypothetical protein